MNRYKLGKLPAVKNSVSFRFRDYIALSKLPPTPVSGGHKDLVTEHNMFGNDTVGDCTCADVGHSTVYWNREANKAVKISTQNVLDMYSAITGYNPSDPNSDTGADMSVVAKYHRNVGLKDENEGVHKIAAYLSITPGNLEELKQAVHLFGACSIGWELPESAQTQFSEDKPWTIVPSSPIEGGHDTVCVGYDSKYIYIVTWGRVVPVGLGFFAKYCDEAIVKLSEEMLRNGKSLEGFNNSQLETDLKEL